MTLLEYLAIVNRDDYEEIRMKLIAGDVGEETLMRILEEHPEHEDLVVANKWLSDRVLWKLVKSNEWRTRVFLAGKSRLKVEMMKALISDSEPMVRSSLAMNKKIPRVLVELLLTDENKMVVETARKRMANWGENKWGHRG